MPFHDDPIPFEVVITTETFGELIWRPTEVALKRLNNPNVRHPRLSAHPQGPVAETAILLVATAGLLDVGISRGRMPNGLGNALESAVGTWRSVPMSFKINGLELVDPAA